MIPTHPGELAPPLALHPTVRTHPLRDRQPVVYFVTNASTCPEGLPEVVKVGTTVDLPGRMLRLQRRRPELAARLVAWQPGDERVEAALHRHHAAARVQGEWFWLVGDLLDLVGSLIESGYAGDDPWR